EGEHEQPDEAAALRECVGECFTEREQRELEAVDEERETDDDEDGTLGEPHQIGHRLLQDDELKEKNHDDDGRQISQAAEQHSPKKCHSLPYCRAKAGRDGM